MLDHDEDAVLARLPLQGTSDATQNLALLERLRLRLACTHDMTTGEWRRTPHGDRLLAARSGTGQVLAASQVSPMPMSTPSGGSSG